LADDALAGDDECHATRGPLDRDLPRLPIKQIAQQAGFQTVQYLTRTLGRLTGDTPAAFPRRHSGRLRGGFSETT